MQKYKTEDKTVVCFDIRSSSNIVEDLTLSGNLDALNALLGNLKEFLRARRSKQSFEMYKFMGDGWLLLFDGSKDIRQLLEFIKELSLWFDEQMTTTIVPLLERAISVRGLSIGIDRGPVIRTRMLNRQEYIGRPVNIACRLQGKAKGEDGTHSREYHVAMSRHVFETCKHDLSAYFPRKTVRKLHNIRESNHYRLVLAQIPFPKTKSMKTQQ